VDISFLAFANLRNFSSSSRRFYSSCILLMKKESFRCYNSWIYLVFFLVSSIFLIARNSSYYSILTLFLSYSTSLYICNLIERACPYESSSLSISITIFWTLLVGPLLLTASRFVGLTERSEYGKSF